MNSFVRGSLSLIGLVSTKRAITRSPSLKADSVPSTGCAVPAELKEKTKKAEVEGRSKSRNPLKEEAKAEHFPPNAPVNDNAPSTELPKSIYVDKGGAADLKRKTAPLSAPPRKFDIFEGYILDSGSGKRAQQLSVSTMESILGFVKNRKKVSLSGAFSEWAQLSTAGQHPYASQRSLEVLDLSRRSKHLSSLLRESWRKLSQQR